jgi:hypothetical protein
LVASSGLDEEETMIAQPGRVASAGYGNVGVVRIGGRKGTAVVGATLEVPFASD